MADFTIAGRRSHARPTATPTVPLPTSAAPAKPAHLGGAYEGGDHNTIMHDVWGYLVVRFGVASVLDVGCGFGHAMEWFKDKAGCSVNGIEGWSEAIQRNRVPEAILPHDLTLGPCSLPRAEYDLAWSAEFLEHIEERYLPHAMDAFGHCRYACVTHAVPGQGGEHHVNEQTTEYWIEVFDRWGFSYMDDETRRLRATDRWHAPWGRRTLTMFARRDRQASL